MLVCRWLCKGFPPKNRCILEYGSAAVECLISKGRNVNEI